jgi:hypothetical protein
MLNGIPSGGGSVSLGPFKAVLKASSSLSKPEEPAITKFNTAISSAWGQLHDALPLPFGASAVLFRGFPYPLLDIVWHLVGVNVVVGQ